MIATGVEVFMMTLGPSTRRGGNVMGMTINIENGEESGQFGVTTRMCTECVREENNLYLLIYQGTLVTFKSGFPSGSFNDPQVY